MFWTPPNWMGLLWAAALFALVLAVAPFVTPRGQIISSPIKWQLAIEQCFARLIFITERQQTERIRNVA
jgi:hypothetical protein